MKQKNANEFNIVIHYADEEEAVPIEEIENGMMHWIQNLLKEYHDIDDVIPEK